jgi:hypothetical protein
VKQDLAEAVADCAAIMLWAVGEGLVTGDPDADDTLLRLTDALGYDASGSAEELRSAVLRAMSEAGPRNDGDAK